MANLHLFSVVFFVIFLLVLGADSTTFNFVNNCLYTVWPATLSNGGIAPLPQTGFELTSGASASVEAPAGWGGRMWARTRCSNDAATGKFSCLSGDCGSGQVACLGAGGAPPTTLMEFTLNGADGNDFYDVSNVDGFNVPVSVVATGGTSGCNSAACPVDINAVCPAELIVAAPDGGVVGCKSACLAFNTDEYCCRGAFGGPDTCKPSNYSMIFKNACPQAYSYAYDDRTSTFTCAGATAYTLTFCPTASAL
ncbi:thaumatin-like protein 1b [Zingiber officinale]|uniref:thaumatin-like protein 1b n=1 Tax=Zingiber officinale TaxID=94328 RepID=UPI001C4D68BE|nr:thaumatin-like protein 1b [Zingiber officinale]